MSEKKIVLGVSGDAGSFSEEAGMLYAQRIGKEVDITFCIDAEGVLKAVEGGEVDYGIFPVVNSRGGLVKMAYKAMGDYLFEVIDELWFEVYQCLMVLPGVKKEDITQISTHEQAIRQCERYINSELSHAKIVEWEDTAKAAKDLSEGVLPATTAVIASSRAAHIYGLELLDKGIQDNHPNLTTFLVVINKKSGNSDQGTGNNK